MRYAIPFLISLSALGAENLPFWTEKATYVEGERLYAVGISSPRKDLALAREEAFDRATGELMNMLQLSDLGDLTVATQRTLDTRQGDLHVVYRLVFVDAEEARGLKEKRGQQTRRTLLLQTEQLRRLRTELYPVLEEHREVARSLQEMERRALEAAETNEVRRDRIRTVAAAIDRRIASRSRLTCEIRRGMSEDEVKALLGEPDEVLGRPGHSPVLKWRYGEGFVHLSRAGAVTETRPGPSGCE